MPNWCEGVLKVRGTRKNIINYLKDLLQVPFTYGKNELPKIDFVDEDWDVIFDITNADCFYLKNTRRAFIEGNHIEFYNSVEEDEKTIVTIPDFKQAWGIIADNYTELAVKHSVDLHIFGYELGMQFTQEVEINDGVIIKNFTYKYDDYDWEVPFSNLGG